MKLLKWWMPLLLVAALVAAGGLAWSQSGSGGSFDTSSLPGITDINPAYDDQMATPSEAAPIALWTVAIDPPTSQVPIGGGTIATVTVTNNIPAAMNNGASIGRYGPLPGVPEAITDNGDLTGDVLVTADIYNVIEPDGCLAVYPQTMTERDVVVKVYPDVTVHPGATVTLQVLVMPGMQAIPGGGYMLKAEFVNVKGLTTPLNINTAVLGTAITETTPVVESLTPNYLSAAAWPGTGQLISIVGAGFGTSGATTVRLTNSMTGGFIALGATPTSEGMVVAVTPTIIKILVFAPVTAAMYNVTVDPDGVGPILPDTLSQGLYILP